MSKLIIPMNERCNGNDYVRGYLARSLALRRAFIDDEFSILILFCCSILFLFCTGQFPEDGLLVAVRASVEFACSAMCTRVHTIIVFCAFRTIVAQHFFPNHFDALNSTLPSDFKKKIQSDLLTTNFSMKNYRFFKSSKIKGATH